MSVAARLTRIAWMSVWLTTWYLIAIAVVPRTDPPDTSAKQTGRDQRVADRVSPGLTAVGPEDVRGASSRGE